jgi:hypothetical protein
VKCPHCLVEFHDMAATSDVLNRTKLLVEQVPDRQHQTSWRYSTQICPACGQAIIVLFRMHATPLGYVNQPIQVWPKGIARAPLPSEVPEKYAADYREACNVLADSAKASAALSRRCLQLILRDEAEVKAGKLYKEIDEVVNSGKLPTYLNELLLDAVRHFGNFAAHPEKDVATGEIIDVEPGEAEWSLDTLEALFDFYFVQPAKVAARKQALDEKLKKAGQKPTP